MAASQQNYGTGRRKSAIARVWITPGEGNISINGREYKEYLGRPVLEILVNSPLVHVGMQGRFDIELSAGDWRLTDTQQFPRQHMHLEPH